jgi:hypothetical protein
LCLAGLGIWAFLQLKVEAYPDISDLQVTVITLHPGHAPEEVEQQVTVPIERALNGVPDARSLWALENPIIIGVGQNFFLDLIYDTAPATAQAGVKVLVVLDGALVRGVQ